MRQPDIEVYVKDCSPEQVRGWLSSQFADCSDWQGSARLLRCTCAGIPVVWYAKAAGSWNSLFFDSARTPWRNDLECAQALHEAFGVEVRCAPGSWQEAEGEADADRWLQVGPDGVREFIWRTA